MMNINILEVVPPPSIYQNVWTCTGGWGILDDYSVNSDCRDMSDVNETADK